MGLTRQTAIGPGISLLLLVVAARPGPQWEETGPAGMGGALCIDPEAARKEL